VRRLWLVVFIAGCATTPVSQSVDSEGQQVTVVGKVSDQPWQHVIGHVEGKQPVYLDYDGDKQTVAYVAAVPRCQGELEIRGTVIVVSARAKHPRAEGERFHEYHVDVSDFRCL
jgi:hypothetical protein